MRLMVMGTEILYNERWQDVLIFALVRCPQHENVDHPLRRPNKNQRSPFSFFDLPPKAVTILGELGVKALKDLDSLPINSNFRAEIAAEIEKIPKFSTFTRCNVV
jgi:hypothetical protein